MKQAQVYCTIKDILSDQEKLGVNSEESDLFGKIEAASDILFRKAGGFVPVVATYKFGAKSGYENRPLEIKPLLEVISIKVNGEEITDFMLRPVNRLWENGPYTSVVRDGLWGNDDEVEIEGIWGLYEHLESLGINITQSTTSEITIEVENGSLLSPGMVLKIEDEQEFVSAGAGGPDSPSAIAATSKINMAEGITNEDEVISVDNGAEFFAGEVLQIGLEDLYVLKVGGNDLSVIRGWNRTQKTEHDDDADIRVYRVFAVVRGVNGTTAAAHDNKEVSRYRVPLILNYLCREIAWLMKSKAASGFTGITGDSEMGSGRYYSEFPPNQIAEVLNLFKIPRF
jgi:hypothetical protein